MLLRKITYHAVWQTVHALPAVTRLSSTEASKELNISSQMTGASLTINNICIPVGKSFARVGYADLGPSEGAVCLALHGAPGSIYDMMELAPSVTEAGFRLLIPEFPGYGKTEMDDENAFDQTTQARTELVCSLLAAINVNRVATVMGHSMGNAAALHLAASTNLCHSAVFLNGIGLTPHRALRPCWLTRLYAWLLENSITERTASRLLSFGLTIRGFDVTSKMAMKTAAISAAKIDFQLVRDDVERLRVKQLPLLSAVTQSDHIVEWQLPVELARRCGATDGQITFFDEQEQVVHGPSVDDAAVGYPRVLVFARGGHVVHRSHQNIIADSVVRLLTHVSHDNDASASVPH